MLIDDLLRFFVDHDYLNTFETQYPDKPDAIQSIHIRESPLAFGASGINYGAMALPVTIRVRRDTISEARAEAGAIFALLDSGSNEEPITLTPQRKVTSRPKPPFYLETDEKNRNTYVVKTTIITDRI